MSNDAELLEEETGGNDREPDIAINISPTLRIRNDSSYSWCIETRSFIPAGTIGKKGRAAGKLYEQDHYTIWMYPKYYANLSMAVEKLIQLTLLDEHTNNPMAVREDMFKLLDGIDRAANKIEKALKDFEQRHKLK